MHVVFCVPFLIQKSIIACLRITEPQFQKGEARKKCLKIYHQNGEKSTYYDIFVRIYREKSTFHRFWDTLYV